MSVIPNAARLATTVAGSVTANDITGSDSSLGILGKAGASGAGGAVAGVGGAGDGAGNAGGAWTITGGAGVAHTTGTGGAGGAVGATGGAGGGCSTGTGGAGGAATRTGGAGGNASGAGTGGAGGSTAATGGAGGTAVAGTGGAGGAATCTGGAGGADSGAKGLAVPAARLRSLAVSAVQSTEQAVSAEPRHANTGAGGAGHRLAQVGQAGLLSRLPGPEVLLLGLAQAVPAVPLESSAGTVEPPRPVQAATPPTSSPEPVEPSGRHGRQRCRLILTPGAAGGTSGGTAGTPGQVIVNGFAVCSKPRRSTWPMQVALTQRR